MIISDTATTTTINNEPAKFFTKDILAKIDEAAKREFLYGAE